VDATVLDVIGAAAGVALIGWYVATKHWIASNLLGLAFSIQGIAFLTLPNYKIGATLLVRANSFVRSLLSSLTTTSGRFVLL